MNRFFTTGKIAKLYRVAPRTVSKWFDSGRLKGYRIPGSTDRRVSEANLVAFAKEYGLPLDGLYDPETARDLVLSIGDVFLPDYIGQKDGLIVQHEADAFAAGKAIRDPALKAVLISGLPRDTVAAICRAIRGDAELADLPVLIVCAEDDDPTSWEAVGFATKALQTPADPTAIAKWVGSEVEKARLAHAR